MVAMQAEKPSGPGPVEQALLQRIADEGLRSKKNPRMLVDRATLSAYFAEDPQMLPQQGRLYQTVDGASIGSLQGVELIVDYRDMEEVAAAPPNPNQRIDELAQDLAETKAGLAEILALLKGKG